ncbi:MAG: FtsQ-type POTRA domain-containing protein [Chitinophagaceae bacterium]|nr:FtsQ-type POTRA domain-containing protein [Chitinophagaceae bacterium]
MNARTTIRRVLFITIWVCIGGGMFTLLLAAINKKNKGECKDYSITIKGAENNHFIDRNDVEQMLRKETKSNIRGLAVSSFNLQQLEQGLEKNTWVSKAELYFDNQDVLHVTITEKEPVARIFTTGIPTFYIDSAGRKMPLSDKLSARVPVFTGFPDKKVLTAKDSILLNDVRVTANYIINDPFWMAQVAQIDITPERTFEMTPVVGNHIVKLGNGDAIDKKFHRLMVFYKQVLSKTGFDKYKVIDVQYEGQVVASKYGLEKGDTVQARKNVEKLLQQSKNAQNDTMRQVSVVASTHDRVGDSATVVQSLKPVDGNPKPVKNIKVTPKDSKLPKAVMPKKPAEDVKGGYN